jgi:hypothetical protein
MHEISNGLPGGPRATSGTKPLVSIHEKSLVNLLLVSTESLIFFIAKDLEKKCESYFVC